MASIQVSAREPLPSVLRDVLNRRERTYEALKNAKVLTGTDYERREKECDKMSFLPELDADDTKASIYYTRIKWTRYCREKKVKDWRKALRKTKCTKGTMMQFLTWICENYVLPKLRRGIRTKRKTINQYWRDFKMLYRRANGEHADANDSYEVNKYINGFLTDHYKLDIMPKSKPVAGPDELLLALSHHWACDESVFPIEDDRLDVAAITLFLAYTGGRPAEFVDASKGDASKDPLGEAEETTERDAPVDNLDDSSPSDDLYETSNDLSDEELFNSYEEDLFDSDDDCWAEKDDDFLEDEQLFDSDNEGEVEDGSILNKFKINDRSADSGYSSDDSDAVVTDDRMDCYPVEISNENDLPPSDNDIPMLDYVDEKIRSCKALCYEDIELWIVQNLKPGGRDLLVMEVFLRHHKGVDNKPKPTIFLFRENDLPILCPISHLLARAIRDDAILADGWNEPDKFFKTDLRRTGRPAIPVRWKPALLKRPVFRLSVKENGLWIKSETEPFPYSKFNFYLKRIGRGINLTDILTSYCFRRGMLNAVDDTGKVAVRDQVARQQPLMGTFNGAYINERVRLNVQDAYLNGEITEDGLTRVFTHMSVRRRLVGRSKAPSSLVDQAISEDRSIAILRQQVDANHRRLKAKYKFIRRAPKREIQEHNKLQSQLKSEKKSLEETVHDVYNQECERRAYNEMMRMQLNPSMIEEPIKELDQSPKVEHRLIERTQLAKILCDFSLYLSPQQIVTRKVTAIVLFIALASRRECQTRQPRRSLAVSEHPIKQESPCPTPQSQREQFPLICKKTQCILCLGDTRLSYEERTRTFSRVSHMMTHVQNVHHLDRMVANTPVICVHPVCISCNVVLENKDDFKNHVARVHKIRLRAEPSNSCF
ncbi:FluG domain-containing protein [Xylogone sp. PMI_703]|nr:FluG domain-containing protein [Xylogone sp. PMI_703]